MTERGVKEGRLCSTAQRSEQSRSVYAVARSGLVEKAGNLAEDMKKSMSKPARQDDRFRGALKAQANIQTILNQHHALLNFQDQEPDKFGNTERRARNFLGDKGQQFSNQRIDIKVQSFTSHAANINNPNRFERTAGYTRTATARGQVQIGKLRKGKHLRAIELELEARNISFDPKETWTKKKERLVEAAKNDDPRFFSPVTSIAAFDLDE